MELRHFADILMSLSEFVFILANMNYICHIKVPFLSPLQTDKTVTRCYCQPQILHAVLEYLNNTAREAHSGSAARCRATQMALTEISVLVVNTPREVPGSNLGPGTGCPD
jgi:hypothetical protein